MLSLRGPTRPVMLGSEGVGFGLRLDAGVESDLTHRGRIRWLLTYTNVGQHESPERIGRTCASSHMRTDAFDRVLEALGALCC